jgi:hypothetical protein
MPLEEGCVAFDLRVRKAMLADSWNARRRSEYLLRTDVRTPLAVDRGAWPPARGLEQIEWSGPLTPFWSSLSELERSSDPAAGEVIAVTVATNRRFPQTDAWKAAMRCATPPSPSDEWEFLGYDVADASFVSGLVNCSYATREELHHARRLWAELLGPNHLFADPCAAADFVAAVDHRVPEHAPFFVFGLWSIRT